MRTVAIEKIVRKNVTDRQIKTRLKIYILYYTIKYVLTQ